jgi:UDP-GlcNAc3NAcA epimerase
MAKDIKVVWPIHPRVNNLLKTKINLSNINLIEPVNYFECLAYIRKSKFVITDSGGLQKESMFIGKKILTLRNETEWPETVSVGSNQLIGYDPARLEEEAKNLIKSSQSVWDFDCNEFGNGNACRQIIDHVYKHIP